jgi:hypothetical protein
MRKLGVLFFLFIYLFSSTELSELLKIDLLIDHYAEHKGESSQISFSNFLYMHYIDHGIENGDGEKDSDLPFHSNSHNELVNFIVPTIIPVNHYSISFVPVFKKDEKKSFYDVHDSMTSPFLSAIWQPPQIS